MVILIIYVLVFGNKYSVVIVKVDRIIKYMIYFVLFIIDKLNFILLYFILFIYKNRS